MKRILSRGSLWFAMFGWVVMVTYVLAAGGNAGWRAQDVPQVPAEGLQKRIYLEIRETGADGWMISCVMMSGRYTVKPVELRAEKDKPFYWSGQILIQREAVVHGRDECIGFIRG